MDREEWLRRERERDGQRNKGLKGLNEYQIIGWIVGGAFLFGVLSYLAGRVI